MRGVLVLVSMVIGSTLCTYGIYPRSKLMFPTLIDSCYPPQSMDAQGQEVEVHLDDVIKLVEDLSRLH